MPYSETKSEILGKDSHGLEKNLFRFYAQGLKQMCNAEHGITRFLKEFALFLCSRTELFT